MEKRKHIRTEKGERKRSRNQGARQREDAPNDPLFYP